MLAFFIELSKDFLIFDSSLGSRQIRLLFNELCNFVQQFVSTGLFSHFLSFSSCFVFTNSSYISSPYSTAKHAAHFL